MTRPIDPETELPQLSGDPVNREIRAAELIGKKELLRQAWDRANLEGWGGEEKCRTNSTPG